MKVPRKYIGLIGLKGAGKSTVADIIKKLPYGTPAREIAFADKLKQVCIRAYSLTNEEVYGSEKEKEKLINNNFYKVYDVLVDFFGHSTIKRCSRGVHILQDFIKRHQSFSSPRECLQLVGTELLRAYDVDCHVKGALQKAKDSDASLIIFSDVRFKSEYDSLVKEFGDDVSFIQVQEANPKISEDTHASEQFAKEFEANGYNDYTIINEKKGFELLETDVEEILKDIYFWDNK